MKLYKDIYLHSSKLHINIILLKTSQLQAIVKLPLMLLTHSFWY